MPGSCQRHLGKKGHLSPSPGQGCKSANGHPQVCAHVEVLWDILICGFGTGRFNPTWMLTSTRGLHMTSWAWLKVPSSHSSRLSQAYGDGVRPHVLQKACWSLLTCGIPRAPVGRYGKLTHSYTSCLYSRGCPPPPLCCFPVKKQKWLFSASKKPSEDQGGHTWGRQRLQEPAPPGGDSPLGGMSRAPWFPRNTAISNRNFQVWGLTD